MAYPIAAHKGVGDRSALQALTLALTRPIDIVMVGDSNQLQSGIGFDHGLGKGMRDRAVMYAGPLVIPVSGERANQGYLTGNGNPSVDGTRPTELDVFAMPSSGLAAAQISAYQATVAKGTGGTFATQIGALDVNSLLRGHYCYGTFPSGSGSWRPTVRQGASPFSVIANGDVISTNTGAYGRAFATLDCPAATRDIAIEFSTQRTTASVAPTIEFWNRIEDVNASAGFAASSLFAQGGQSLYGMASWAQTQTDAALTNYFEAIRYIQVLRGLEPVVVVYLNSGMNDRGETSQPSLGPNPSTDPDSPEAYIDNLDAVRNRIEEIYTLNGWALSGLYWLIVPAHRISDPQDAELVSYGDAAELWAAAKPRTSVVRLDELTTYAEKFGLTHYAGASQSDPVHQLQAGYEFDGGLIAAQAFGA